MSIELANNIQRPTRSQIGSGKTINADDLAALIEHAQQRYARQGAQTWQVVGPFETTSTTLTVTNDAAGPDLDQLDCISTVRKPDSDGAFAVDFAIWGRAVGEVKLTVSRIDDDGTVTALDTATDANATDTYAVLRCSVALTEAQISESGSTANDHAILLYQIEFSYSTAGTETKASMLHGHITETELTASEIP